jgi:predicted metal-dependent enzyme (double-stranded beta helix superfamily)
MGHALVEAFIDRCRATSRANPEPADCVLAAARLMQGLLSHAEAFMEPKHYRRDLGHYARNAVALSPDRGISLFSMVWSPGQWTPVHDHGTWGVVAVLQGVLEERNYIRTDGHDDRASGIKLRRGGVTLLAPGTVTTFVPNPDHIHVTGVPAEREQAVSLHLYGREMTDYHVYDVEAGTRRKIEVAYEV